MKIGFNSLRPPRRHASRGRWARRSALTIPAALAAAFIMLSVLTGTSPGLGHAGALAAPETVSILADDCSTPKTTFYLGEKVCAVVRGAPEPSAEGLRQRVFQWVTPGQWVSQQTDIFAADQKEVFAIPSSGPSARTGRWSLRTVDNDPGTQTISYFLVRDPRIFYADLQIEQLAPTLVAPGEQIEHRVLVSNKGPEYAKAVELVVTVPTQTTFVAVKQASGMPFVCDTPARGETGRVICRTDYLKLDQGAEFAFYYQVDREARDESVSSNSAEIYNSSVEESTKENNFWTFDATVAIPRQDVDPGPEP